MYSQRSLVLVINIAAKRHFTRCISLTIKTEGFSFKYGCAVWVVKHLKVDWLVVLWH